MYFLEKFLSASLSHNDIFKLAAFNEAMERAEQKTSTQRSKRNAESPIRSAVADENDGGDSELVNLLDERMVRPVLERCHCESRLDECSLAEASSTSERCFCFLNVPSRHYWPCYHLSHWFNSTCNNWCSL